MNGEGSPVLRYGLALLLAVIAYYCAFTLRPAQLAVLNNVTILVLFAAATNLLLGTTGLVSFGQACFYGVGAYTIAIPWQHGIGNFWISLAFVPVTSAVTALFIGALTLRSKRWFFALLTLSFSQLFYTVAQKLTSVTGGDTGIFGPMIPDMLSDPRAGSLFILTATVACLLLLWVIDQSAHGLILRALRENQRRIMGLGVNVHRTQLVAFILSGAFCGIAGALSVVNQQAAYPGMMDWNRSGDPVMASVMGGMYTFLGPVLGAIVFQLGHDLILRYTTRWQITLGVVILAIVLAFPDGVSGLFKMSTWASARRRLGGLSMGRAE